MHWEEMVSFLMSRGWKNHSTRFCRKFALSTQLCYKVPSSPGSTIQAKDTARNSDGPSLVGYWRAKRQSLKAECLVVLFNDQPTSIWWNSKLTICFLNLCQKGWNFTDLPLPSHSHVCSHANGHLVLALPGTMLGARSWTWHTQAYIWQCRWQTITIAVPVTKKPRLQW